MRRSPEMPISDSKSRRAAGVGGGGYPVGAPVWPTLVDPLMALVRSPTAHLAYRGVRCAIRPAKRIRALVTVEAPRQVRASTWERSEFTTISAATGFIYPIGGRGM